MTHRPPERWAVVGWSGLGMLAWLLLPWHQLPGSAWWQTLPAGLLVDAGSASALGHAVFLHQPGLLACLAALVVALFSLRSHRPVRRGCWLLAAGLVGVAAVVLQATVLAPQPPRALGAGAALVATSLLVLGGFGLAMALPWFRGDRFAGAVATVAAGALLLLVAYPLARGLGGVALDTDGPRWADAAATFGGARSWSLACLRGHTACGVGWNTLFLALLTACGTTVLGTLLALAELRGGMGRSRAVRMLATLPFVAPPFVTALALILLFGRSGLVSQVLEQVFGIAPSRWLYGLPGLWLAQLFAFTPVAYLIVRSAVAGLNPALEDAAGTLGADARHTLKRVTLPLLAPALGQAFLVGFLESVGDFGSAIVVGGSYAVLSTDIFYAIVGGTFAEDGRALALAWVLALFALSAFTLERWLLHARHDDPSQRTTPGTRPTRLPPAWENTLAVVAAAWLALTLGLYACAIAAAFVDFWGRDFRPTLQYVSRAFGIGWGGQTWTPQGLAWPSLANSLTLAAVAACVTASCSLLLAWLLQRHRFPGQAAIEFATLMAFALPGTVMGLSFLLVFDRPPLELNGTVVLIVLCLVLRNLPVTMGIHASALQRMDRSLAEVSQVLGAHSARTLWHVELPLLRPALVGALVYSFVRGMTTVSAVVFLVTPQTELATTYIIGRVGQGDYGLAFAYSGALVLVLSVVMALTPQLEAGARLGRVTRPGPRVDALPT